ncbi:MAG: hypothetical protein ABI693_19625 [Bryobacteraceae bacterium]
MSEMTAPAVAVFLGDSFLNCRPAIVSRLPAHMRERIEFLKFDAGDRFASCFVEELRESVVRAAGRGRFGGGPQAHQSVPIVLVSDPYAATPPTSILELVRSACPAAIPIRLEFTGVDRRENLSAWRCYAEAGTTVFLLSPGTRDGIPHGPGLNRIYSAFVLSLLATRRSRFTEAGYETLSSLRNRGGGRMFLCAIEVEELPDFGLLARGRLLESLRGHYLPEISPLAHGAAVARAAANPAALLTQRLPRSVFEPEITEPVVCAAVAGCRTLEQAAGLLGHWADGANGEVSELLRDLQVGILRWMLQRGPTSAAEVGSDPASAFFQRSGFPLLPVILPAKSPRRVDEDWRELTAVLRIQAISEARSALDKKFYEFLPHDLGPAAQVTRVAGMMGTGTERVRLTVRRYFPSFLTRDEREEVLEVGGAAIVIYLLELVNP